jgi:hypothetical protein
MYNVRLVLGLHFGLMLGLGLRFDLSVRFGFGSRFSIKIKFANRNRIRCIYRIGFNIMFSYYVHQLSATQY